jgi:hypothetical protein
MAERAQLGGGGVKLSGREYSAVLSLFAAVSHFQTLYPMLKKRAELVPGTWEKMQETERLVQDILDAILATVPQEKLLHIKADVRNVKLYIRIEPPGCVPSVDMTGFSYVPTKTLNQLLCYVMEHECMMCDQTPVQARKCPVKEIFEKALPHEVSAQDSAHCRYSDMSMGLEV